MSQPYLRCPATRSQRYQALRVAQQSQLGRRPNLLTTGSLASRYTTENGEAYPSYPSAGWFMCDWAGSSHHIDRTRSLLPWGPLQGWATVHLCISRRRQGTTEAAHPKPYVRSSNLQLITYVGVWDKATKHVSLRQIR